ncbi:MAG: ribosome-associated translation inhibitor RaiA [Victivallaceae bacterium]|nr:ribosome-associated translation inhibitor RaiA [Victivallaceae bacterium]
MQIITTGKHLDVTEIMKSRIEEGFAAIFAEKTLKVSTIRVMVEFDKPRFIVDAVVSMKNRDFAAKAEDFDVYKAIAQLVDKVRSQVDKYLTKVQDHCHEPLRELEKKATDAKE